VKRQPFPREFIPLSGVDKKVLKADAPGKDRKEGEKKGREISFGEFAIIEESDARKFAHLGELMREKNRAGAAAEEYGKAHKLVGSKYEALSNKYALALLELNQLDEAEKVLNASLTVHPGVAATNVHLGRIHLRRKDWSSALAAYMAALATDPFDGEIHVALFRVHEAMGAKDLMERARKAAVTLTGLKPDEVSRVARVFARETDNLAEVSLPAVDSAPAAAPVRADAGASPAAPSSDGPATR
jgi:tetratricopeptide (TPR) repeat protein